MRGGGSELRGVNLMKVCLVCHCVRANEHLLYIVCVCVCVCVCHCVRTNEHLFFTLIGLAEGRIY
jgi:hypothetical protein